MLTTKQLKLIKYIEKNSNSKTKRLSLFKEYAKNNNLSYQSVRNYYYAIIKNMTDKDIKEYNINPQIHLIESIKHFNLDEIESKIKKVLKMYYAGNSLRKSCLTISNNDSKVALRLQNKIRNMKLLNNTTNKSAFEVFKKLNKEQKENKNIKNFNKQAKLLSMPEKKEIFSDQDISNLFMGLIKLVKRNTEKQILIYNKKEYQQANDLLQNTIYELNNKNKQLQLLKYENNLLQNKVKEIEDICNKEINYETKINQLKGILNKVYKQTSI